MSAHAIYSPSGAKKWMTCVGSIAMEAGEPEECNEYTDEGTAAHQLSAMSLSANVPPAGYIGRVLEVVNGVYWPGGSAPLPPRLKGHNADIRREFTVDADMVTPVHDYVNRIREYAAQGELMVEERVPVGHITNEEGAEGTADAVVYLDQDGGELQVHDLKYGRGVRVFAEKNPQGMLYLLGALHKFAPLYGAPKRFRFVIHQPRLYHLDEWSCTHDELMSFAAEASKKASAARHALETRKLWMGRDSSYLTAGAHCAKSFCRARATCPALAVFVSKAVGADFEVLAAASDPKRTDIKPDKAIAALIPTDLKALGEKGAVLDIIADWCKQVRAKIEAALFESMNSGQAQGALGFKIVEGKKGNRQWANEAEAEALMKKKRMKVEEIYDMSVKTPPAIEKALKDEHPAWWKELNALVTQKKGQPSVTELADKRPALVLTPVDDEFTVYGENDLA